MTVADLNEADLATWEALLGNVFEHSPWVAHRAWARRPFADLDSLHTAMVREVEQASPEEQLALLRAHPDLGSRLQMSDTSAREQAGAGLHTLAPDEAARLMRLNTAYRERFGFPFLLAVRGADMSRILAAIETRSQHPVDDERQEALRQVARIARFRLEDLLR